MSGKWLDDLSEDWVSQPRSSPPQVQQKEQQTKTPHTAKSRIPQLRSSLGPRSSLRTDTHDRISQSRLINRSALRERSVNIRGASNTSPAQANGSVKKASLERSQSEYSQGSVVQATGTTRRAASSSPNKDRAREETPEWKRRLLHGKTEYGDKTDLFSPCGLEKMFQQPSKGSLVAKRKVRRVPGFDAMADFPSSPPPWLGGTQADKGSAMFHEVAKQNEAKEKPEKQLRDSLREDASEQSVGGDTSQPSINNATGSSSDSFSPVFVAKHNDERGGVGYAAIDMSKTELEQVLAEQHARSQSSMPPPRIATPTQDKSGISVSLPDDLETGTPGPLPLSDFVGIRRGGYSADSSFLRRPLSPSPTKISEASLAELTLPQGVSAYARDLEDASQTGLSIRPPAPTPPAHATPPQIRQHALLNHSRLPSSPLKSFEVHDSVTSKSLGRRMSRIESEEVQEDGDEPSAVNEVVDDSSQIVHPSRHVSVVNHFGNGELDEHAFVSDSSSYSINDARTAQDVSRSSSPTGEPPGAIMPERFRAASVSSVNYDTFKGKRRSSRPSVRGELSLPKRKAASHTDGKVPKVMLETSTPEDISAMSMHVTEGKRPRSSPQKDRTPKRRRTLLFDEFESLNKMASLKTLSQAHEGIQSVVGRKRKDARHSGTMTTADATTLANRHILRPRNPTPSQRRRKEIEQEVMEVSELYFRSTPRLQKIREHLQESVVASDTGDVTEQGQARALAEEVAAFSIKVQGGMRSDGRKKSVTTQDFLDEATKIMDFFRRGKRPASALKDLEESDTSSMLEVERNRVDVEVGDLTLSRPPSREGRESRWRERQVADLAPSVEERLKHFQDRDDEDFVASSFQSLSAVQFDEADVYSAAQGEARIESDPPNVVVYGHTDERATMHGQEDGQLSKSSGIPSHKSQPSIDSSASRTTLTTTSAKSAVGTLHPAAVPHLLSQDSHGMRFDKQQGKWLKSKSSSPAKPEPEISQITASDEDPFGEIPDLTVDEAEEREMISPSRHPSDVGILRKFSEEHPQVASQRPTQHDTVATTLQPQLVQSRNSVKSVEDAPAEVSSQHQLDHSIRDFAFRAEDRESVEHEIAIHEGRSSPVRSKVGKRKVSHLRISFSSPLVTRQLSPNPPELGSSIRNESKQVRTPVVHPSKRYSSQQCLRQCLKPVEEIKEVSILSVAEHEDGVDLSIRLATPLSVVEQRDQSLVRVYSQSPVHHSTFYMSDLSEFTISKEDDERDLQSRAVAKRSSDGIITVQEDRFREGNAKLVSALQDVEPEELFWEDLKQIVLTGKNLTSLHLLDVLCDRVEALDLTDNQISQLGGMPPELRCLDMRQNQLTSLTSWDHLRNLQYVDVSNNDIDSLLGFGGLVHLRELTADGNSISTLDGIMHLDGLLSLSLRENSLRTVDLRDSNLLRLERLDLSGNMLGPASDAEGLLLHTLTHLCLDNNDVTNFDLASAGQRASRLQTLSLCGNKLHSIAIEASRFSALRNLVLDNNKLTELVGIQDLANLELLSLKDQTPDSSPPQTQSITSFLPNARFISISGTFISHLTLPNRGLSRLTHLQLSSCNFTQLSSDLATKAPNLQHLDVSFNSIESLAPLVGLKRLETLLARNNQIARLRKLHAVLARLGPGLVELDLRCNPIVAGIYDPSSTTVIAAPRDGVGGDDRGSWCDAFGRTGRIGERDESCYDRWRGRFWGVSTQTCDEMEGDGQTKAADELYVARLGADAKLRRRVYEVLVAAALPRLRILDGLRRGRKEDLLRRDDCWARLVELGVLRVSGKK